MLEAPKVAATTRPVSEGTAPALDVALVCLAHPSSMAAVLLLLLNDHALKGHAAAWLTGKLSDFAGVYFFPFLLAIALAPLGRRLAPRSIGRLSFALTAAWFAAIELSATGERLTALLVAGFRGPVSMVRDTSDLWALCALLPAWALWRHAERADAETRRRTQVAVTAVAALACIATSEREHASNDAVVRLEQRGQVIVATVVTLTRGNDACSEYWYQPPDTWHLLPDCAARPADDPLYAASGWPQPVARAELVHPRDPSVRLRRAPGGGVYDPSQPRAPGTATRLSTLTSIGIDVKWPMGDAWRGSWRVPHAAAAYHVATYGATDPAEDFRVFDLIWTPGAEEAIAALGTEGVLIGGDGSWRRVAVGPVTPDLPFSEPEVRWLLIARTWPIGLIAFWVTVGVLGPLARRQARLGASAPAPAPARSRAALVRSIGWWLLLLCALLFAAFFAVLGIAGPALGLVLVPALLLFLAHQLATRRSRSGLEQRATLASLAAGLAVMVACGSLRYAYPLGRLGAEHWLLALYVLALVLPPAVALVLQLRAGRSAVAVRVPVPR